jgi:hypothetical protein
MSSSNDLCASYELEYLAGVPGARCRIKPLTACYQAGLSVAIQWLEDNIVRSIERIELGTVRLALC